MSDTGATPPPAPPAKKSSGMNQRIGPFELRIWLVLIAAGLVIGMVIRRRTAATPAATAEPGAGDFVTQGATLPLNGGQLGGSAPTPTNHDWLVRAAGLIAQSTSGYDPAEVDAALRKIIEGTPVTSREMAIYSLAIQLAGTPPEDVPAVTLVTAQDSPTIGTTLPTPPAVVPPTSTPMQPVPSGDPNVAKWNRATELKNKLNASVAGGPPLTDAEALEATRYFTTSDPTISPLARMYWRLWLNQHGYTNQFG